MEKRPRYLNGIGVFRGARGDTAWLKIGLPHGGTYKGKYHPPNSAIEIKMGQLSSWGWDELEAKHAELQRLADRGEQLDRAPEILFSDWARDWLKRAENRMRSHAIAKVHVDRHLTPFFGEKPLTGITVQDINRWIATRLAVAQPATVKRELGTLGSILSDAVRSGNLEANPCEGTNTIRGVVGRQRFLTSKELVRLLKSAEATEDWLPDFILWCVHSGMRKSEVCNLRWPHVRDLENGRRIVSVDTTKTDLPRIVHCTPTMCEILDRQKQRSRKGDDRIFPVSPMTLRRRWEAARKEAGLMDVTVHDLRRTHSTHAAVAGVDLRTLAGRLGHTDLKMLERHYAAFVGSADADAADTIGRLFERMTGKTRD
ncbi:MAG TPA: site-specific integrase [Rhodospirillaceae bacterium]|nr:site-specific integrase [Rhodospirillaceae bacterium]|tara:strand:- start:158 stop:1270 length:1113 start_codon:yes stop_codon:yes gene_type:complete